MPIACLWIGDGSAAKIEAMFEELDYRENDAIQVSLLWNRSDDSLTVRLHDARTEDTFDVRVQAHEAMDGFCHPFAYAARRGAEDQRDQPGFFFSRNALRPS